MVNFTDGAVLTETDLDTSAAQALYALEEVPYKFNSGPFTTTPAPALGTLAGALAIRGVHSSDAPFNLVGSGDETTALASFFNHAISHPGVPHYLDAKTYQTTLPLPAITTSNVWIEGRGAALHDAAPLLTGTVIKYIGSPSGSGTLASISAVSGASNLRITNVVFRGIGLDANSLLGSGLTVASAKACNIDVAVTNATVSGVSLNVVASLAEARDTEDNVFRLRLRQVEAPGAYGLVLNGDATANVSFNHIWVDGTHKDVALVNLVNSDLNVWSLLRATRAAGGAASDGIALLGGASSALASRNEKFIQVSLSGGQFHVYGTESYTSPSVGHIVQQLAGDFTTTIGNGGASMYWLTPTVAAATVAGLPAAGNAGRRAVVRDATATTFNSIVAGGGAATVPVYDDGTNWRIG
jgi:hypothetical protein